MYTFDFLYKLPISLSIDLLNYINILHTAAMQEIIIRYLILQVDTTK